MEKTVRAANIDSVARQRNLLLVLLISASISCTALSLVLLGREERVFLTPGLNQGVWLSDQGVSASYIEETASMYLPFLLDLDSGSIDWKKERLMAYVSRSDPKYMKELNDYFARTKEKYRQFTLSTHFAVKSFEVNQKNLTVKASGQLISRFGERGFQSVPAVYALGFEWVAGKLLLTNFVSLSKDENGSGNGSGDAKNIN